MNMKQKITVYAPATMANISVGFDILGAAISPISGHLLGDTVSIEPAPEFQFCCEGNFANKLPSDPKNNIVYKCWQLFCAKLKQDIPVKLTLSKNMPVGSGLGSSACSIVSALVALNQFTGLPLTETELLAMMGTLEGEISGDIHYDNVAPSYLGGMQLILEQPNIISQKIPDFDNWFWVIAYSGILVSTAKAREILPKEYSKQNCVQHGRNTASFVHACYSKQEQLAANLINDIIAEPYRKQLLPNFDLVKQKLLAANALACGISGSGPTMFAIADNLTTAQQLEQIFQTDYLQNELGFSHICKIDHLGSRVINNL